MFIQAVLYSMAYIYLLIGMSDRVTIRGVLTFEKNRTFVT